MTSPDPYGVLCALRTLHVDMESKCLNGRCFDLYTLLKQIWPDAKAWYDGDHVITEIDSRFWDIRGEVLLSVNHMPMTDSLEFNRAYEWGRRLDPIKFDPEKPDPGLSVRISNE